MNLFQRSFIRKLVKNIIINKYNYYINIAKYIYKIYEYIYE